MEKIEINNIEYEVIKDYKNAFNKTEFQEKCTDYFIDFDYIVGDIAYNKLRLKGFYDAKNKKVSKINNFSNIEKYLKEDCAVDCKYFIVKKCL